MGGKASVLLVLGFSVVFLMMGFNFNTLTNRAVDNMSDYFLETKAHNIAVSAANIAAARIFFDKTWEAGYTDVPFDGGTYTVFISNNFTNTTGKVVICHSPPGNPDANHTMSLPAGAVAAHLAHGDVLGVCDSTAASTTDMAVIVAEGTYEGITKTVIVELQPSYFSKFGNFYDKMSAYPATGDTFSGPFHVNDFLKTWGTPVFQGKTTSKKTLKMYGAPKDPKFYGGYENGIDIPRSFDTTGYRSAAQSDGMIFKDTTGTNKLIDVEMEFNSDGTATYRSKIDGGSWSTYTTAPLTSITNNGLIYIERGNLYVKGTVNGAVSVVASKRGSSGAGNIFQTDDLIYNDDPRTNPNTRDVLGLMAEEDIRLQYNDSTKHHDIHTHASMYSLNGDIGPDNALVDNDGVLASWKILGGLIAEDTRVTAHYNSLGPYKGYKFVHTYDERLMTYVPPWFPKTENYEIVSWYE